MSILNEAFLLAIQSWIALLTAGQRPWSDSNLTHLRAAEDYGEIYQSSHSYRALFAKLGSHTDLAHSVQLTPMQAALTATLLMPGEKYFRSSGYVYDLGPLMDTILSTSYPDGACREVLSALLAVDTLALIDGLNWDTWACPDRLAEIENGFQRALASGDPLDHLRARLTFESYLGDDYHLLEEAEFIDSWAGRHYEFQDIAWAIEAVGDPVVLINWSMDPLDGWAPLFIWANEIRTKSES